MTRASGKADQLELRSVDNPGCTGFTRQHRVVTDLPDPDWYFDNVLSYASPGDYTRRAMGPTEAWRTWWESQARDASGRAVTAVSQGFAVTTRQLCESGWADHDLRRESRRGTWSISARGTASAIVVDGSSKIDDRRRHALRATSSALLRPGQVISGRSAAVLHGLPTFAVPGRPQLTAANARLGARSSVSVRGATLCPDETCLWFGARVTTVARTLVDLARHDRRDGLMAADAALRESLVDGSSIDLALERAQGWPGVIQARELFSLADPLAESPLESITRLALHDDGFPRPTLQVEIRDPRRRYPWRVDLLWPAARLIVECDGQEKYTDAEARRERRREARLRALGYRVERVMWDEVVGLWPETSARLRLALAA